MNCTECRATLYPEDPRVSQYDSLAKRWLPPLCQGCSQSQACEGMIERL
jgi:hypothetical protein